MSGRPAGVEVACGVEPERPRKRRSRKPENGRADTPQQRDHVRAFPSGRAAQLVDNARLAAWSSRSIDRRVLLPRSATRLAHRREMLKTSVESRGVVAARRELRAARGDGRPRCRGRALGRAGTRCARASSAYPARRGPVAAGAPGCDSVRGEGGAIGRCPLPPWGRALRQLHGRSGGMSLLALASLERRMSVRAPGAGAAPSAPHPERTTSIGQHNGRRSASRRLRPSMDAAVGSAPAEGTTATVPKYAKSLRREPAAIMRGALRRKVPCGRGRIDLRGGGCSVPRGPSSPRLTSG